MKQQLSSVGLALMVFTSVFLGCRPEAEPPVAPVAQSGDELSPQVGGEALPVKAPPRLSFDENELTLTKEEVKQGRATRSVKVTNRGERELVISNLSISCNCTNPTISDNRLAPGEEAEITLAIRPSTTKAGSASVDVQSNDPTQPFARITVSWEGQQVLKLMPGVNDFGDLMAGETREVILEVKKVDGTEATLDEAQFGGWNTVLMRERGELTVDSATPRSAVVRLTAGQEIGEHTGAVYYHYGDEQEAATARIQFHVRPPVWSEPAAISITRTIASETETVVDHSLTLRTFQDQPCQVVAVRSEPDDWLSGWSLVADTSSDEAGGSSKDRRSPTRVRVKLKPTAKVLAVQGELTLEVRIGETTQTLKIPISVLDLAF